VIRPHCLCPEGRSFGHLFLVGYRCTGKTSVGRRLAKRLRSPFVDGDAQVIESAGMGISDIVSIEGWESFRRRERRAMKDICRSRDKVVATGGGAVLDPGTRRDMQRSGIVVWLTASVATIAARMANDPLSEGQRPALSRKPRTDEIAGTLTARVPFYAQTAHIRIVTDNRDFAGICDDIMVRLSSMVAKMTLCDTLHRCRSDRHHRSQPPVLFRHRKHLCARQKITAGKVAFTAAIPPV